MRQALEKLASLFDGCKGDLVRLRYFVRLSFERTSEVLGITVPTFRQWWACVRAWFSVEMAGTGTKSHSG